MDLGTLWAKIGLDDGEFASGLRGSLGRLQEFAPRAVKIAAVAGVTIAAAMAASLAKGMSLEAANDQLAAELGLSAEESARYGKLAGELYAQNYGDSIEGVNGALAAVLSSIDGMRDASNEAVSDAAKNALNFAKVLEIDVDRAAQLAGQAINQGLAKDAAEAFDLMTAGMKEVPKALRGDFLDAIDEYGGFLSQMGLDGREAFGFLAEASKQGQYGIDKAGDALKEFSIRATDLGDAGAQQALKDIGLSGREMADDLLAGGERGGEAMGKIVDGLLEIKSPSDQATAAIALFGVPLEDLGKDNIPAFLKALDDGGAGMENVAGAAKEMDTVLNDNAIASLQSMKRQAEMTFGTFMNWALPAVNNLAGAASDKLGPALSLVGEGLTLLLLAAETTFGFIGEHQLIFSIIAGTITVLLLPALAALVIQAAIAAASTVASWIAMSAGAAVSAAAQIASLTLLGLQWIFAGGQALLSAAKVAAAWLIAMGPIGLVIAAVIAVVILIVKNWDKIKAATAAAWSWVVSNVVGAWNRVSGAVSRGVSSVVAFVRGLPGKIKGALSGAGSWLLEAGKDVMRGLRDGIEAGFDWVKSKLSGVGRAIPGWLKKVLGISSPSKVMRDQVGYWIPAGVAEGIDAGAGLLQSAVDDMAASVVVPISAAPSLRAAGAAWAAAEGGPGTGGPGDGPGGAGGPGVTQNVYPTPGMDERQVGDYAAARLVFALKQSGAA